MPDRLPLLPLLLLDAPPALAMILAQEGVPFREFHDPGPADLAAGRFVVFDPRRIDARSPAQVLGASHILISVERLRDGLPGDPFAALLDTSPARLEWPIDGLRVRERVGRIDRAALRRTVLGRLRAEVERAGGLWARLSAYPHPYRSAFNLRLDLDEPVPADYWSFARARRPLDACTTHFVSTAAYGDDADILRDLAPLDAQSHGHHHVVYRDESANRRNLERARDLLARAGIHPTGFAGPEGRWNPGLDRAMEAVGCRFSSEFAVGRDDLPFYPWLGDRPSNVLQVPVHPICEGVILEAGGGDEEVSRHLSAAVRALAAAGRPAFVYGHPERRLGRMPGVIAALAETLADLDGVWRTTLGAFADWWRRRGALSWSLHEVAPGVTEARFDRLDGRHTPAIEVLRGDIIARLPAFETRVPLHDLSFRPIPAEPDLPAPSPCRERPSLRRWAREALDWEKVTPVDDLPDRTLRDRLKKGLRRRYAGREGARS